MIVDDVKNEDVVRVSPETPLKDVARLLAELQISGVPVVDGERVVGVISETDIVNGRVPEQPSGRFARQFGRLAQEHHDGVSALARTAGEAMSSPPITIEGRKPLADAAALMSEHDVNRLPVMDDRGLAGIIARADVVRAYARSDDEVRHEVLRVLRSLWVSPETVSVEVDGGRVELRGEVTMPKTAKRVAPAVEQIPGVVSVHSELEQAETETIGTSALRRASRRFVGGEEPTPES
jgi:CBS domain-containing protein